MSEHSAESRGASADHAAGARAGSADHRHAVDIRVVTPGWLGGTYVDIRMGRDRRSVPRAHLVARPVQRMNRFVFAMGAQMLAAWLLWVGLGFYWVTQSACGGGAILGTPSGVVQAQNTVSETGPGDQGTESELPVVATQTAQQAPLARSVLDAVNAARASQGLAKLSGAGDLDELAQAYSERMAAEGFFSHEDPEGNRLKDRITAAGISYQAVGENLAKNRGHDDPAAVAVTSWLGSAGHRANILNPGYSETGVGIAQSADGTYYFTELFIKRPGS